MSPRPGPGPHEKMKLTSKDGTKTLSKLMKSTQKYWLLIILAGLFILVNVIISVIAPNYVSDLTNEISNNAATATINMNVVINYITLLAIMYVASALCSY